MCIFILFNSNEDQKIPYAQEMNLHKFITRGTQIAGIEATNRW